MIGKWPIEERAESCFNFTGRSKIPDIDQIRMASSKLLLVISAGGVHRMAFFKGTWFQQCWYKQKSKTPGGLAFCWSCSPYVSFVIKDNGSNWAPLLNDQEQNPKWGFSEKASEVFLKKQIRKQHTKLQMFSLTHDFQVTAMSYWVH